jgi:uncharacterized protein YdhG (YjbR/CyaY superfamily)
MGSSPGSVDEYLAAVPAPMRGALQKLRTTIRRVVPDADECISYGIPTFKVNGRAVSHFAGFKSHCSFFPGAAVVEEYAEELKGFKTSKGTIQFTPDRPIPEALIERIVRARLADVLARAKRR